MKNKIISCCFPALFLAIFPAVTMAAVFINEAAWMGGETSANDEWIELRNDGQESVDLAGWTLAAEDGTPDMNFSGALNKIIPADGYYLLERTDDGTVPEVAADLIFTGALGNNGEVLILKDKNGVEIDRLNASSGWPAGDNASKQTMQRTSSGAWVTAEGTPKASNYSSNQASLSSQGSGASSEGEQGQLKGSISGDSSVKWPEEERIYASAGEDRAAIVGADVTFSGKSLGLKKEPLENARYLWNFGDGSFAEGKSVRHFYKYPGNYIVALDVSSGQYSVSDRLTVKVAPNELGIIEANEQFVKLENKSSLTIDISGWFLKSGNKVFKFPNSSFAAPKSELMISSGVSHLKVAEEAAVEFLYPNGSAAFVFSNVKPARETLIINRSSSIAPVKKVAEPSRKTDATIPSPGISVSPVSKDLGKIVTEKMNQFSSLSESIAATGTEDLASVITIGDDSQPKGGYLKWLILALVIGFFAASGLILTRRPACVQRQDR
ncbi:PKD domain-containing protein [Candidatus Parcubacteria bacterium]|nr:MAG: PKD domain-containing protein [Candidatus Parcubacteria bacterium]